MAALLPPGVAVVGESRAPILDGPAEDGPKGVEKGAYLVWIQAVYGTERADPRGEGNLRGVDVADAGNNPAVEQNVFDRPLFSPGGLKEGVGGKLFRQRFRAQVFEAGKMARGLLLRGSGLQRTKASWVVYA